MHMTIPDLDTITAALELAEAHHRAAAQLAAGYTPPGSPLDAETQAALDRALDCRALRLRIAGEPEDAPLNVGGLATRGGR